MMDNDSTSQADIDQQNSQNPTTSASLLPVSSTSENRHEPRPLPGIGGIHPSGFMGKHRMTAAVAYLDQQIQIIQEELDLLETVGLSSTVCKEIIDSVESVPDALLPETKGPVEIGWERWFQGAHGTRSRRKWI